MRTPPAVAVPPFEECVRDRYAAWLRAAYAISGDRHAAEDLLQVTLVRVGRRWDAIRDPLAIDAYVRRSLVREHASTMRRPATRQETALGWVPEPRRGSDEPGPLTRAELWDLVLELPPRQRAAVALRYYEQLSEAETAAVLGCSVGTVKSSTSRGLATLRRRVG